MNLPNKNALTCGVSRIDDDNSAWDAVRFGSVQRSLQLRYAKSPVVILIQVIVDL